jgi:3-oxoacyl-[acyl-carrier protein] reductase
LKIDFLGKTVLVTGATRGIGRQVAEDIEQLGGRVLLTGTNKRQIDQLNEKIVDKTKKRYFTVNFTDGDSLTRFLRKLAPYKRIDVCINNAGINRLNEIGVIKEKDWTDMAAVNMSAPLFLTKRVSDKMKKNKYGRIVNISSIWGSISKSERALYSMTKSGLQGLTTASAVELGRYNILINAVSPGFVDTELTRNNLSQKEIDKLTHDIPLGRLATTKEISNVILFLASESNTYLTGQNIIVDGGFVDV